MTKLYNEIKDLEMGDAINILNRVGYKDLQREYKELADLKGAKEKDTVENEALYEEWVEFQKLHSPESPKTITHPPLHDSAEGNTPNQFVDTSRKCIIDGCENRVMGRVKKCPECKGAKCQK